MSGEINGEIEMKNQLKYACPVCGSVPKMSVSFGTTVIRCGDHVNIQELSQRSAMRRWKRFCRTWRNRESE